MTKDEFEQLLVDLRPRLHRYCARMTGSAIDGEDVVQDVLLKAIDARAAGAVVDNHEGWLFRIAHNACLDLLRKRWRRNHVPLGEEAEVASEAEPDAQHYSFQTFLRLPELQRAAVILKDVLGHSIEEIADIADCSTAACKSALQRGRIALKKLTEAPEDARLPIMSDDERRKLQAFVDMFRTGDFDAVRRMLADDVKLDLVARLKLQGRDKVDVYFTRYGEVPHWRFALGAVDGRSVMLVFDARGEATTPSHFVDVGWRGERIATIRDFLFAPYAMEAIDWVQLA